MKKLISIIVCAVIVLNTLIVFCNENNTDWLTLYNQKIEEIENEYRRGIRNDYTWDTWQEWALFFSVQDINFDGVPEMYHTACNRFEGDYSTISESEEIYYIKDGQVLKGSIEAEYTLGFLPMNFGKKAGANELTRDCVNWQYVMKDAQTGEMCFITHDSYNGFIDYPDRVYSKLIFDTKTGVLSAEILLKQECESYTVPEYLTGYEYIGSDTYFDNGYDDSWDFKNWKPVYIAPKVTIDGVYVEFDAPPVIVNDRTLVPVRRITEALGASVEWNEEAGKAIMVKDGKEVVMTIGQSTYFVNGQERAMDVPAQLMGGRTVVPVRALSESFDFTVDWDEENEIVIIKQ